ncbi:response regulator transcription factor [Cognatilysobacter tabacisoli]|uniref:response regulator transcription factor n=1 Tax=Cognatilysobacter tabacisoli TaxID=2315424 RepID=UPI0022AB81D2|nr:response regulator transcription factor [Lysobacter tabacisoli]
MLDTAGCGMVLLVEDNRGIAESVGAYLEDRGFEVDYASDGQSALRLTEENTYDAIVLDVQLPRLNGIEVCRHLRQTRVQTPVLMLTARDTLEDKLTGLDAGADDYLVKPFATQELDARLRNIIRRARNEVARPVMQVGDLRFDPVSQQATRGTRTLELSPIGRRLLAILMRESPRVVSRREIEQEIWGDDLPDSDTLRSHLYNLRRAIDRGFDKTLLHTVMSMGYRLSE